LVPPVDRKPVILYPESTWKFISHPIQRSLIKLKRFAASKGKEAAQVMEETVDRMLERQAQFIEGVNRSIAAAERGDLIEHGEAVNRIEQLFKS